MKIGTSISILPPGRQVPAAPPGSPGSAAASPDTVVDGRADAPVVASKGNKLWSRPTIFQDPDSAHVKSFGWDPPTYWARGLEMAQISGAVAQTYATGTGRIAVGAFNGAVAVGTLAAGVHDLVNAKTNIDRLGGVASLALGADAALTCWNLKPGPGATTASQALAAVYGGADVILGCYDMALGLKQKDKNYAAAGFFEAAMGAGVLATVALPQFGPIGDAVMMVSLFGRHLAFERELFQRRHQLANSSMHPMG